MLESIPPRVHCGSSWQWLEGIKTYIVASRIVTFGLSEAVGCNGRRWCMGNVSVVYGCLDLQTAERRLFPRKMSDVPGSRSASPSKKKEKPCSQFGLWLYMDMSSVQRLAHCEQVRVFDFT